MKSTAKKLYILYNKHKVYVYKNKKLYVQYKITISMHCTTSKNCMYSTTNKLYILYNKHKLYVQYTKNLHVMYNKQNFYVLYKKLKLYIKYNKQTVKTVHQAQAECTVKQRFVCSVKQAQSV